MNWGLVWWFIGVMGTLAALKFVIVFFKSIFNKDAMRDVIDRAGDGISAGSQKLSETLRQKAKKKAEERKQKQKEENRAVVIYR